MAAAVSLFSCGKIYDDVLYLEQQTGFVEVNIIMTRDELTKSNRVEDLRKQVISQFAGISIDMDYILCIPSIHAKYQEKEIVIDFGGHIRQKSDAFPQGKEEMIIKWVKLHEKEIIENHYRVNNTHESLIMIEPLNI